MQLMDILMQRSQVLHKTITQHNWISCQNARVMSRYQSKTTIHELPEVEDGKNAVLLFCPLVKIRKDANNKQNLKQNKSSAILAQKHTSQNNLGAWK